MTVIHAFFDESHSGKNDPFFVVAGYVFKTSKLRQFEAKWKLLLAKYKLPFFRMAACAHGNPPFDKLTKAQRDGAARTAIALIKEYASVGIGVATNPQVQVLGNRTVYPECVWMCLAGVKSWATDNAKLGSIGYYFESGHPDEKSAKEVMGIIFNDPALKADYRCVAYGFVGKEDSFPAQAADLLAWHMYTQAKRPDGKSQRLDFQSLLEKPHWLLYDFDPTQIKTQDSIPDQSFITLVRDEYAKLSAASKKSS